VKLLLDTHVVLWAAVDPDRLAEETREAIEDGANDVYVSAISAWKIAIKQSLGKLTLDRAAEQWLPDVMKRSGFESLAIDFEAALRSFEFTDEALKS
jgi:PIN domain nuclease of toxin-antitoxin system